MSQTKWNSQRARCGVILGIAAIAYALPHRMLVAQRAPAFGGIAAGATLSDPARAGARPSVFADADLGYIGAPNFRLMIGAYGFASERATDADGAVMRG